MNYAQLSARLERFPGSPLFARLASEHLDAGRVSEARKLCETGLLEYPEYATAHLILAECDAAENRYRDAVDSLLIAWALNPDSLLYSGLLDEWEELLAIAPEIAEADSRADDNQPGPIETLPTATVEPEAVRAPPEGVTPSPLAGPTPSESEPTPPEAVSIPPVSIPPTPEWVQVALKAAAVPPGTIAPASKPEPGRPQSVQDDSEALGTPSRSIASPPKTEAPLPQLVAIPPLESTRGAPPAMPDQQRKDNLAAETVNPLKESVGEVSDEGRIVSKTLAEIYVTQGAFDEAILTYRLLKRARPELVPQIDRRIGELEVLSGGR